MFVLYPQMVHTYFKLSLLKLASLNFTGFSSLSLKKEENIHNAMNTCILLGVCM